MGSGSSRSKRRLIKVSPGQQVKPQKLPAVETANDGKITTVLGTKTEDVTMKDHLTDFRRSNLKARDPDLQLLDEVLAESEDCLPWQGPTGKGEALKSWAHGAKPGFESWPQPKGEVKSSLETFKEAHKQLTIQPIPLESASFQSQHHENNSRTGHMPKSTFYTENDNLPKEFHGQEFNNAEESAAMTFDDTEEALMDSIEEEYSRRDA